MGGGANNRVFRLGETAVVKRYFQHAGDARDVQRLAGTREVADLGFFAPLGLDDKAPVHHGEVDILVGIDSGQLDPHDEPVRLRLMSTSVWRTLVDRCIAYEFGVWDRMRSGA